MDSREVLKRRLSSWENANFDAENTSSSRWARLEPRPWSTFVRPSVDPAPAQVRLYLGSNCLGIEENQSPKAWHAMDDGCVLENRIALSFGATSA